LVENLVKEDWRSWSGCGWGRCMWSWNRARRRKPKSQYPPDKAPKPQTGVWARSRRSPCIHCDSGSVV